jgi:hypothetical protein
MIYLSRQSVREEAGFQEVDTEALAGVVDGVNASFAVSRTPIVDNTNDDVLGISDVLVRVDGVPVPVSSVDGSTGLIVLASAPAAPSEGESVEVTAQYASSPLPDSYIDELITEAEAIVNAGISKFKATPLSPEDKDFPTARRIAKLYAGGFALIRDYGKNTDTEETSKDGYEKLRTAKSLLEQLIGTIKENGGGSASGGTVKSVSEGHVFGHHARPNSHNFFMRKDC